MRHPIPASLRPAFDESPDGEFHRGPRDRLAASARERTAKPGGGAIRNSKPLHALNIGILGLKQNFVDGAENFDFGEHCSRMRLPSRSICIKIPSYASANKLYSLPLLFPGPRWAGGGRRGTARLYISCQRSVVADNR